VAPTPRVRNHERRFACSRWIRLTTCNEFQVVFQAHHPWHQAATITVQRPHGGSTPASATISGVADSRELWGVVISGTQQNLGSVQVGQAGTALGFHRYQQGRGRNRRANARDRTTPSSRLTGRLQRASRWQPAPIVCSPLPSPRQLRAAKSAVVTAKSGATVMGPL